MQADTPTTLRPGLRPRLIVVMGVSGTGKTTFATALHEALGWPWQDADPLHSAASRAKMAAGIALDDQDRAGWLTRCHDWLASQAARGEGGILACSALKRRYRDRLGLGLPAPWQPIIIHLCASPAQLAERLTQRTNHFMPASLLPSQLATLEPPQPDELAWSFDATAPVQTTLTHVLARLAALPDTGQAGSQPTPQQDMAAWDIITPAP